MTLWSPTFFSNFVLTFLQSVSTYSCSRQIIRGFSKIFKIEKVRALSVRSIYKGENAWHPLVPLGTAWDRLGPLRQFYMYVFQRLIARSVGARLTSKSLQNSFHAKENRIRPCCFFLSNGHFPLVFEGLVLRVDSRKTRNTREKCDFCSFSICSRLIWLGMTP